MKEYKFIKQKSTPIKKDSDFEDLLNSYAKTGWCVINTFVHRGVVKAVLEREKRSLVMSLKIAFTDIDGTLLSKERIPSEGLKKEVARITKKKHSFCLNFFENAKCHVPYSGRFKN